LIDGNAVTWLFESRTSALVLVDGVGAPAVWQAIAETGRTCGITCVGLDAIERYLLLERAERRRVFSASP